MAVDSNFASMFNNLKLEDPWLPPRPWESIPSQSGSTPSPPPPSQPLFDTSSVSEASLVRLALNALQGVQSAIISIEKLSDAFCTDPADRSFHQIPNLWSRVSSTHALGNILKSIGCSGSLVFLLHKFVDYFTNFNFDNNSAGNKPISSEPAENQDNRVNNMDEEEHHPPYTLVNQAFAVAVRKVLEGYICALDTLYSSVSLRHSSRDVEMPLHSSFGVGCVTAVLHSDITLLEVYLHTRELSSQIEALGNICNLHDVALCFSISSFEDLIAKALLEFSNLPRGGDMLSYLYTQLQVADPAHRALLKFLFLQSCEPYFGFIRAWIYKAEINDPYKEFIVEHLENLPSHSLGKAGFSTDFPSVTVKERDGVAIPCFLKDFTILLVRAGQQLQVVMKLLELCNYVGNRDHSIESFLPCWTGFSSEHPSYASPLVFNKVKIEAMTLERNNYYKRMQEKVESFLTKLELNYQQGSLQIVFANDGGTSAIPESFTSNDVLSAPPGSYMVAADVDFEASSVEDDYSYSPDPLESSECSSLSSSEDHIESEKHIQLTTSLSGPEQKYFSALKFSMTTSIKKSLQDPLQSENSFHIGGASSVNWGKSNGFTQVVCSHHKQKELNHTSVPLESGELGKAILSDMQSADGLASFSLPINSISVSSFCVGGGCSEDKKVHSSVSDHRFRTGYMGATKEDISHLGSTLTGSSGSIGKASDDDHTEEGILASLNLFTLPSLALKSNCSFLSKNPLLTKNIFSRTMSRPRDSCNPDHWESFPYFDFSSVEDPCKVYGDKLSANSRHRFGSGSPSVTDSSTPATSGKTANYDQEDYDKHGVSINNFKMSYTESPLSLKTHSRDDVTLTNASGGGGWQSLLGLRGNSVNDNERDHRQSLSAMFEIPLDFIIDKCLLQEILLQYKYISKLTIKLLEEGFDLHEHLLALRRYHFMELADWADLFIMSLWHHKWSGTEVDHRVSGMQGILELSLQRSSCEQDHNKNRLFVYMKKHGKMPLSTSTIGVRSFDFIGLGYRVDWPVSIVLTPDAMKIYGDIFSFLIQVKVAVFSLTDVWRSLKELKHFINKSCHSNLHEREVHHFNLLIKIRYQVSHFVSTLQQYVQSQLSHVSWCRFLHSLQHKVKDMMDLETVHMEYLTDSLHICFLSGETNSVAIIIQSILQCALDFRSCLTGNMWDVGVDQEDPLSKLSRINISQVLATKQSFEKNLKQLHLCYLRSPKHGESGLSRFWGYLNFNEYYGDYETGSYSFSV